MTPRLCGAEYLGEYRIFLTFDDGKRGVIDLKHELWGDVFEPLRDVELFRRFRFDAELDTIVWPTGADLAPEYMYENAVVSEPAVEVEVTQEGPNAADRLAATERAAKMIHATDVEPRDGYRIWLRYSDGTAGEVDLSDMAGRGVFKVWLDRTFFEGVHVSGHGSIAWSDDIELCEDALYMALTGKSAEELFPALRKRAADA